MLSNDDDFRHDCARYTENIELGRHDEDWLYQAWTAHEKHKRGDFDGFVRKQVEEEWDVKIPKGEKEGSSSGEGESDDSKSSSSSPTSVKNVRVEDDDAAADDAAADSKTGDDDAAADGAAAASKAEDIALSIETESPIPVVTKAMVVKEEDSEDKKTDQTTAVPEVAANGE